MSISVELFKVLPGFTLDVKWESQGGIIALFGPSGAGKTLTLECLAGVTRPDGGRIMVRGRTLYDPVHGVHQPARDRRLGVVFQGYALFPHLTVAQNLGYPLHRLGRRARRARVEEMLERLDLVAVRHLHPGALAAGEQQRVALGRALVADPEMLLLDEPLAALEHPLRQRLQEELGATLRSFGKTAVVVTHDLTEASRLASDLVVYDRGRVLQAGPRDEVLNHPATPAVAARLGIRNLLEGTVVEATAERVALDWRGHRLVADRRQRQAGPLPAGERAAFFIRPEHVRLMRKDRQHERRTNLIPGVLVGEIDLGDAVALRFLVEGSGAPPDCGYDLEIQITRLAHRELCLHYDRRWTVSVQPGAVELLTP